MEPPRYHHLSFVAVGLLASVAACRRCFAVPAVEGGKKGVWKPGVGLSDRLATCFLARGDCVCLATNFFLGKGLGD